MLPNDTFGLKLSLRYVLLKKINPRLDALYAIGAFPRRNNRLNGHIVDVTFDYRSAL